MADGALHYAVVIDLRLHDHFQQLVLEVREGVLLPRGALSNDRVQCRAVLSPVAHLHVCACPRLLQHRHLRILHRE